MRKKKTRSAGEIAEDVVAGYLKKRKYKVLARNWEKPWGELDIVARKKKCIIFVEVKALRSVSGDFFRPEEHFTHEKARKVMNTAHSWLSENDYKEDTEYRIDLAAVELDFNTRNARLRYYKNATVQ